MKRIAPTIILIALIALDISALPLLLPPRYALAVSLLFVMAVAMRAGTIYGIYLGIIGGLLMDITVGYPLGYMAATYVFSGLICGLLSGATTSQILSILRRVGCVALTMFVFETVTAAYQYFYLARFEFAIVRLAMIRILIAVIAANLIYFTLGWITPKPAPVAQIPASGKL